MLHFQVSVGYYSPVSVRGRFEALPGAAGMPITVLRGTRSLEAAVTSASSRSEHYKSK